MNLDLYKCKYIIVHQNISSLRKNLDECICQLDVLNCKPMIMFFSEVFIAESEICTITLQIIVLLLTAIQQIKMLVLLLNILIIQLIILISASSCKVQTV